ncbi:MAG: hypothetical protein ACM3NR_02175, partial [Methanosarcina sp.]
IIHLIAGIIFMLFQVSSIKKENEQLFAVELQPVEEEPPLPKQKKEEQQVTTVEKALAGDNELLNIARNLSNKSDQKINAQEYIDMVKDEMIKNGQLGKDNYIDEQKMMKEKGNGDEEISTEDKKPGKTEPEKPTASQKLAANYKGPTRIYYDLPGRTHTHLPIPIYMCQGSGKVALAIEVAQKGEVLSAKVITSESTTADPCLIETAVNTALMSRFNPDVNSPRVQEGTLTYHFVAQ